MPSGRRGKEMTGETIEFKAVDYRPPSGAGRAGAGASPAVASLSDGEGVRRLDADASSRRRMDARADPVPSRRIVVFAVVLALAVFLVALFAVRGAMRGLDGAAGSEQGAASATDAYVALAVAPTGGDLESSYLVYADSIRSRAELYRVPAEVYSGREGVDWATLADVYAASGLVGLADGLSSLSGVSLAGAAQLEPDEAASLFALIDGAHDAPAPGELASSICSREQGVGAAGMRGLLRTLRDVGSEGVLVLDAPTLPFERRDGTQGTVLDQEEWLTVVAAMRDPASGGL